MKEDAGPEFRSLVERVSSEFIKDPPAGKHGKYISHSDVAQIALAKLGRPHSWEVVEVVRGFIPAGKTKEKRSEGKTTPGKEYPERPHGVVGVLGMVTVIIDGVEYVVTEAGEANSPQTSWDWENVKTAASDAYKRCWMRLGVGLELWVEQGSDPSRYWLDAIFNPEETDVMKDEEAVPDPQRPEKSDGTTAKKKEKE